MTATAAPAVNDDVSDGDLTPAVPSLFDGADEIAYWQVLVDFEIGGFINGDYRSGYHPDSALWIDTLSSDRDAGYAYLVFDSAGDPNSALCEELLEDRSGRYRRTTSDRDDVAFKLDSNIPSFWQSDRQLPAPFIAMDLWRAIGLDPDPVSDSDNLIVRQSELTATQLGILRQLLPESASLRGAIASASMITTETESGHTRSVRMQAEAQHDEESVTDGALTYVQQKVERLRIEIVMHSELPVSQRVTNESTLLEAGGCRPPSLRAVGDWTLVSMIDETGQVELDHAESGTITIGSDGAISGMVGCRSFTGKSPFGFFEQSNVVLVISSDGCGPLGSAEIQAIDVLGSSPSIAANMKNQLFAITRDTEGRAALVAVFAPADR